MEAQNEPIAIIGTGCRFPGSCDSPSKLWELLEKPRDLLKKIPNDRFSADGFYHPKNSHHGTSNVRHSYLLDEDLRTYDAQFFGVKAIEASSMDPQQRLLMETVYEALESAGLSIKQLQGSDTAVYVGVMSADFMDMLARDVEKFPTYFATGTARSILSNRLSYFYDWHGPSMTIDTACSSSLIALHQAVQVLRSKQSKVAVAAGSNIILGPEQYIAESKLQMLSPDGRSRMWDAEANGYARGEGVAAVVLKTLSQALADGDHIECIIRETGINQDGKTPGITMPSATAQAALIRSTYARAGLDLRKASDRPQFFEAHGTGTPAGDPIEAAAISKAFFGDDVKPHSRDGHDTLFVGSIKTVIGHTEGTAGLAAIIKASTALQAGVLPPNRLFHKLNPKIEPYYSNLKILTEAQPWPRLPEAGTRRVSVNSFGFGGANAHAIVESADGYIARRAAAPNPRSFAPCPLSAASETVLTAMTERLRSYLKSQIASGGTGINMRDLAWTLCSRRSTLGVRSVLPAAKSPQDLLDKLEASAQLPPPATSTKKAPETGPRVFGVFTGQGAQCPRMGAELIEDSPTVAGIVRRLDQSLQSLPVRDRPSWTLREHLLAPKESSQVYIASLSQPLCTALQIILVDLLKVAGITFSGVVGHSSGEIGAAYAAGYLTASDAIRVAYYRGLHLKLVTTKGAMLAAGTTFADAQELCSLPAFEGRACVAASNSPASVTLSGDADAIEEIQIILGEEKKFNRMLQVDRAYHSHHMNVLAAPYKRSLEECGIKPLRPAGGCRWVSSVFTCDVSDIPSDVSLGSSYWVANLVQPVRFTKALEMLYLGASMNGGFDLGIEVGPHPALQGPVKQTVQEFTTDSPLAYTGLMKRGENSTEAMSKGLGYIWQTFGEGVVDFAAYEAFCAGEPAGKSTFAVTKGLPTYPWDHSRTLWQESRLSKAFRTSENPPHELLGRQLLDGVPDRLRWRNIIKRSEIDWLEGHQVQGQIVFPAAGYISACVEACMLAFARDESPVQCIELLDFDIGHAMVIEEDDSLGVDATIELSDMTRSDKTIEARFGFHSTASNDSLAMNTHASCRVVVNLGISDCNVLPPKPHDHDKVFLLDVEAERFYNNLDGLGFNYSGPFRALEGLKRRLGYAEGFIQNASSAIDSKILPPLLVHPATLDLGIQAIMLAYSYPGDTMLRSIYLPTRFERILIDPALCADFAGQPAKVPFDAVAFTGAVKSVTGDINIYSPRGTSLKALQLEGLQTRPLSESEGISVFTDMSWNVATPDSEMVVATTSVPPLDAEFFFTLERVGYYYHRVLNAAFPRSERDHLEWNFKRLLEYNDSVLDGVDRGRNPFARAEWRNDSKETIAEILDKYPNSPDLRLLRAVGENIVAVVKQETTILEHMIEEDKLNIFYEFGEGFPQYASYMGAFAGQLAHRYPHMRVLEIGGGTGMATKAIIKEVGDQFSTYDFTDVSSGFFPKASATFSPYKSKMNFQVLDIEKDPLEQGFKQGSYDLIVASLVLHATRNLAETMTNVRKLLKPGGYLLLMEVTENEQMRFGLLFGGLPGAWLGAEEGRTLSPCVGMEEWESVLKKTGFGVETCVPHHETLPVPFSVIVAQALDDKVQFLKQPLVQAAEDGTVIPARLTIVGGGPKSSALASEVTKLLGPRYGSIRYIESLDKVRGDDLGVGGSLLCLADLDGPVLQSIDEGKLRGFQDVFQHSKNVLWVTSGVREGDPYARMVIGFGRTIVLEMLHLRLQFLDLESNTTPSASAVAATMLRFDVTGAWDEEHGDMSSGLLHSTEPELFLDAKGRLFVPRFKHNHEMNNRYQSSKANVKEMVDADACTLELCRSSESETWELSKVDAPETLPLWVSREHLVDVHVMYSVNRSVAITKDCFLFPILGKESRTGRPVVGLAPSLTSKVVIPSSFILHGIFTSEDRAVDTLETFFSVLIAHAALGGDCEDLSGTRVIVVEPRNQLANSISGLATGGNASVLCLTSKLGTQWTHIGPKTPKLAIKQLVRPDADARTSCCILDMAEDGGLAETIASFLPSTQRRVIRKADLTAHSGFLPARDCSREIRSLVSSVFHHIMSRVDGPTELPVLAPTDATGSETTPAEFVVSWKSTAKTVAVSVEPIETRVKFQADKTYWLVGLTGNLGLSLCAWMVNQGARNIVVGSKNPKIDGAFLAKMKAKGVNFKVLPLDVCDRDSVRATYKTIASTMPAVAGVCQGAMVLHDTMFTELDVERVEKVTRPKVQGSLYLEEIFHDTALDFFVFFSSIASVVGNPGQSAYAAANMFMSGLATQRRKRGLNASAVAIGAIFGNGYVTRELTLAQQEYLKKVGNRWLSEQDFHTLFAEAVYAGQSHRGKNHEFATGLMTIQDGDEVGQRVTWFKNPMFQHSVMTGGNQGQAAETGKSHRRVQTKVLLQDAVSSEDVREIIYDAFALKLQEALQVEKGRPVGNLTADTLGIDSLVAVDIRSWFIKELQVEVPVLKILSGATVDDIIAQAQKLLPKELIPKFDEKATGLSKPRERWTSQLRQPRLRLPLIPPSQQYTPPLSRSAGGSLTQAAISKHLKENRAVASAGFEITKSGPISFAQSRFWFLQHFLEDPASALNITVDINLQGALDVPKLEKAVASVGRRHEALRTRFTAAANSEGVVQEVLAASCLGLEVYAVKGAADADAFYKALSAHRYRLDRGENMRIVLLRMSPKSFRLLIGYHHINMDGVSLEVVLQELQLGYSGRALKPESQILQYPDFSRQQHLDYDSGRLADDLAFWRSEFRGQAPPVLPLLPLAKIQSRKPLTTYSTTTTEFCLDEEEMHKIQAVCQMLKVSPFHFHLAIFYTLLARLVDVDDLCIGVSSANRQTPETMSSVGMYLNLLPLVFKVDRSHTFANAIKMIRAKALAAFSHAAVPFDLMIKDLGVAGTSSHSPVFQAMVNYRPGVSTARRFCDCDSEVATFKQGEVPYDLAFDIMENPGGSSLIMLTGQSVYYGKTEMEHIKGIYLELVKSITQNPATRLKAATIFNSSQVDASIQLGRGIYQKPQWPATLVHRIDDMAKRYPDNIAVKDGRGDRITYREMSQKIDCISHALSSDSSCRVKSTVGVLLDPSSDWICSILAILRLGATYVPLDIVTGWDRLSSVVRDSKPDLILVNNRLESQTKNLGDAMATARFVNIENLAPATNQRRSPIATEADHVAALMYTSGSTGVPKAIVIKHESMRNSIEAFTKVVGYREGHEVSLHQSSYSFDMSLSQIFLDLANGGTVHVVPRELRGDPEAIASIIAREGITFTSATPSEVISWIEHGSLSELGSSSWRKVVCGGEPVKESLINGLRKIDKPDLAFFDGYGPTEITFCCAMRAVDYRSDAPPDAEAGGFKPWPNVSVYILDADQKIVPAGVTGEIAIGGGGVVAGYGDHKLSAAAFKHDKWASSEFVQSGWTRLHLTGDVGKIDPIDGTLKLKGRIAGDTQIKLRGMRLDVREVELAIMKTAQGQINDVVVTAHHNKATGASSLIAFAIVADPKASHDFSRVLARLPLPQYMRPAAIFPIDNFPTNASGKVDRIAIRNLDLPQTQDFDRKSAANSDAHLTDTESRLAQLWTQVITKGVISQYQITNESNFFHVGGTSILLVQLRSAIEASFGTRPTLFQLFEAGTLAAMAALIAPLSSSSTTPPSNSPNKHLGTSRTTERDWEEETRISPDLVDVRGESDHFGNPTVVVLTGATGFLGRSILARLLQDSVVEKIHCLAVRSDPQDELFRSPKVVVHRGDLAARNFGMPSRELADIFSEAHAVIHNGADVSFMKTYATLKPANFESTKQLVRLCLPRRISFHYVSSASIVQLTQKDTWGLESVQDYPPIASRNATGYVATKWASERYLEKVSDQCDLPIWIHRPSSIKNPEAAAAGRPGADLISNLMHYSRELRCIPEVCAWNGWLDFVAVETAASEIVDEVYRDFSWPGHVCYLYQSGDEIIPLPDLRSTLQREAGCEFEVLKMDEWVARAQAKGMSELLGDYLCASANAPVTLAMLQKGEAWH
uniref:Putative polyketide synthase/peptide synthetase n=1 Tax=Pyricularia grisea TaxID=148305 RepID=Q6ZX13_PYRGI|nr:putative polyketide synthase/peptide synthetase [Pyricularia grisea]